MPAAARVPPVALVLAGVASVQFGAALGKSLFDEVGVGGTVFLRVLFAALVLGLVWRPSLRGIDRRSLALVAVYGLVLGGMNLAFYSSLDRIPLGVAVTLEFVGPLGVAVWGRRGPFDLVWVVLAAAGILLLANFGSGDLDPVGVGLALFAGVLWGSYILLTARVGRVFSGGGGLALAMAIGALALGPLGVADGGTDLLAPSVLGVALGVAILSSAIPYAFEMEALRRMPEGVFGVLMSIEPAMAALVGFLVLDEGLGARELVAILLVIAASAGASRHAFLAPRD